MERILDAKESEDFLKRYLPVAKSSLVRNFDEALKFVGRVKYPVVLKLIAEKIIHKSDVKAVSIVENEEDMAKEFDRLLGFAKKKRLKVSGILVQEFLKGKEVIIGLKKDETFEDVIMVGIGGIYTEVLRDVSFRVCPINFNDADEMLNELKLSKILYGVRGEKGVNLKLLKSMLVKVSKIPEKNNKLKEMDINPLIINSKDGKVADARIVLE